jgi:hypothetical protein
MISLAEPGPDLASRIPLSGEDGSYTWIEDDGLLRDEGAVFGLAGNHDALAAKIACIRSFFESRCLEDERKVRSISGRLEHTRERLVAHVPIERGWNSQSGDVVPGEELELLRYSIGLLLSGLGCAGTFVLLYEVLAPSFERSAWITLAVGATCLFGLFQPLSIFFRSDVQGDGHQTELWKTRFTEVGLPLSGAAFVVLWSWETLGVLKAVALLIFLSMLLLLAGRLFLSLTMRFVRALHRFMKHRAAARLGVDSAPPSERPDEIERLRGQLESDLSEVRTREEWQAISEAKVQLFLSEWSLAASTRPASMMPSHLNRG